MSNMKENNFHIPTPEEIKKARKDSGKTQWDIAHLTGISQAMIARIESGTVDPSTSTLRKVIAAL